MESISFRWHRVFIFYISNWFDGDVMTHTHIHFSFLFHFIVSDVFQNVSYRTAINYDIQIHIFSCLPLVLLCAVHTHFASPWRKWLPFSCEFGQGVVCATEMCLVRSHCAFSLSLFCFILNGRWKVFDDGAIRMSRKCHLELCLSISHSSTHPLSFSHPSRFSMCDTYGCVLLALYGRWAMRTNSFEWHETYWFCEKDKVVAVANLIIYPFSVDGSRLLLLFHWALVCVP